MTDTNSRVIAVVTEDYVDYQKFLVDQIASECLRHGFATLCVSGHEFNMDAEDHSIFNTVYSLCKHENVVGIVFLTGTIVGKLSAQELAEFIRQFPQQKVSFGLEVPGINSVTVEDKSAMCGLMTHLLGETEAERFVFVRGLSNDAYSLERESIFRQALTDAGREVDEALFIDGNYDSLDTYRAVTQVLDDNENSIDVIVAANDTMALGAARAASARGLEIPRDILVSGFDDTEEATRFSPALTTVRQPLLEMVKLSLQLLVCQIRTGDCNEALTQVVRSNKNATHARKNTLQMRSELVIRGSTRRRDADCPSTLLSADETLSQIVFNSISGFQLPENLDESILLESLRLIPDDGGKFFLSQLNSSFRSTINMDSLHWWSNFLDHLESIVPAIQIDDHITRPSSKILTALTQLRDQVWSLKLEREFQFGRMQKAQTDLHRQISSCINTHDIIITVQKWLEQIQPRRFFLVSFDKPSSKSGQQARLIHGFCDNTILDRARNEFETVNLLPAEWSQELEEGLLILNPIFAGEQLFGYLLIDPTGLNAVDLHPTSACIGNAMRNQYLAQRLEEKTNNLKIANKELSQLASYDVLTGLRNRLCFQTTLQAAFKQAAEGDNELCIFFLDLDGFKLVNDSLGHNAGDLLLQHVATELERVSDNQASLSATAFRLGGDEFTIILQGSGAESSAESLGNESLRALANPILLDDNTISVSASIGYSVFEKEMSAPQMLLQQADAAMYRAKQLGKNVLVRYHKDIETFKLGQLVLEQDLRKALEKSELELHFQPRIKVSTGAICGVEALTRWYKTTSDGRVIKATPNVFIPLAESTGLIYQLDMFALEGACKQLALWQEEGIEISVSVNISLRNLQRQGIVESIANRISAYAIKPHLLEIEISESASFEQLTESIATLEDLKRVGVQLSIDNFGTGCSSLKYLKLLPLDMLKLDGSLFDNIQDTGHSESVDGALTRAFVTLGQSLQCDLVAAGVDTREQLRFIEQLGCHQAQGNFIYKPVPASELTPLLGKTRNEKRAA